MKKQKPKIIEDKKLRGEWAESVFMARANQHGLPVSKPWGEMCSYDFVIGKTGRFVSVQVKSTLSKEKTGYVCTVRGGHQAYSTGAFDFLAAYVVPEDA
jgi:PD-(D/E)XK endonuclease